MKEMLHHVQDTLVQMVIVLEMLQVLNVELDYAVKRLQQLIKSAVIGKLDANQMENNALMHQVYVIHIKEQLLLVMV